MAATSRRPSVGRIDSAGFRWRQQGRPIVHTLQWTVEDAPPTDESQFSSRLRAVWLIGTPRPEPDDGWADAGGADGDLVEVTPAFAWVS
jgi:hypothetical protein